MSCAKRNTGNAVPYQGQRYRLTYPEKNAVWWSPTPDDCTTEKKKECCQRMLYTPTPQNQCKSTFMPWDRPDPYQCLNLCKGINALGVSGCQAQQMQNTTRKNTAGCIQPPCHGQNEYTSIPFNTLCLKGNCNSNSILTDPMRNPPPPPEYGQVYTNAFDPILWTYGNPYTY